MRLLPVILLLSVCPAFSADADYNGRWDITAKTQPRPRAWWVELNGVGSANPTGKFVSAYNGDMNTIDSITVEDGVLHFIIKRPGRGQKVQAGQMLYTARLAGGKLEGTFMNEGRRTRPRGGPQFARPSSRTRTTDPGKKVSRRSFQRQGLTGWQGLVPGAEVNRRPGRSSSQCASHDGYHLRTQLLEFHSTHGFQDRGAFQ